MSRSIHRRVLAAPYLLLTRLFAFAEEEPQVSAKAARGITLITRGLAGPMVAVGALALGCGGGAGGAGAGRSSSSAGSSGSSGGSPSSASSSTSIGSSSSSPSSSSSSSSGTLPLGGPIYVAPNGADSNPGTITAPIRTVAKAQSLVRAQSASMTADLTVYLRGGTYPLTGTLAFGNADSGKNGHYVKYMAYASEQPLITGGVPITGWKLSDATKKIHSVTGVTNRFRQLYVNGNKAIRARNPNLAADGAANFNRISGFDKTAHNVQISSADVANWKNLPKVEMHYMINWTDNVLRLASYTTSGATAYLKFQSPEDGILFARAYPQMGLTTTTKPQCYYLENAYEFLDQPGEWYLDETANTLYYMPRSGEDMATATVVVPVVETLLAINGKSTTDQAGYLWFQGLTFAHSTYLRPSQYGLLDEQAGQFDLTADGNNYTVGRPAAGVTVSNANHIHFERNMFTQMAATGLDFISGTHDDMVIGNVFTDLGGGGISIGKFAADDKTEIHIPYNPADPNEICTNDTIKENYVNNITTEIQGACGIMAGYPRNIDIEHNEVSNANYTGISVGFGWTADATAMSGNKINYNNVHHIGKILADGSAIYTLSNQAPGSEMQYNYVHDFAQSQWADYQMPAMYLDEGTTGYTVAHNVMINTPGWIAQNRTGQNTVTDNGDKPSGAATTMATAGIEPAYAEIKSMTAPLPKF